MKNETVVYRITREVSQTFAHEWTESVYIRAADPSQALAFVENERPEWTKDENSEEIEEHYRYRHPQYAHEEGGEPLEAVEAIAPPTATVFDAKLASDDRAVRAIHASGYKTLGEIQGDQSSA